VAEAESCFLQAADLARRKHTRSLELRAVVSLSRLWQQQGKHEAARAALAETLGWFTEGFGTADVAQATTVLQQLSR
jgi:hypothetical protein